MLTQLLYIRPLLLGSSGKFLDLDRSQRAVMEYRDLVFNVSEGGKCLDLLDESCKLIQGGL